MFIFLTFTGGKDFSNLFFLAIAIEYDCFLNKTFRSSGPRRYNRTEGKPRTPGNFYFQHFSLSPLKLRCQLL